MSDVHRVTEISVSTESTEPLTGVVQVKYRRREDQIRNNGRSGAQDLHRTRALSHAMTGPDCHFG